MIQLKGKSRRRAIKRAKKQAKKDERLSLFVAIRMQEGHVPSWLSGQPVHKLRQYLDRKPVQQHV